MSGSSGNSAARRRRSQPPPTSVQSTSTQHVREVVEQVRPQVHPIIILRDHEVRLLRLEEGKVEDQFIETDQVSSESFETEQAVVHKEISDLKSLLISMQQSIMSNLTKIDTINATLSKLKIDAEPEVEPDVAPEAVNSVITFGSDGGN